jgi:hypothetical protein
MAHWARWSDPNGAAPRCEHLDATRLVSPRSETCERCAATGLTPVALLICLTCGWVACSDLYVVTGLGSRSASTGASPTVASRQRRYSGSRLRLPGR